MLQFNIHISFRPLIQFDLKTAYEDNYLTICTVRNMMSKIKKNKIIFRLKEVEYLFSLLFNILSTHNMEPTCFLCFFFGVNLGMLLRFAL